MFTVENLENSNSIKKIRILDNQGENKCYLPRIYLLFVVILNIHDSLRAHIKPVAS